ncbi:Lrp/AsnC family transcriptional regulator [Actinocorallia populi]|uniref:Lrp/AsnC family transcriptional regulator n=1 Tax=Actinocorallia populi TaxID=2079200 RepID=UPI000D090168|nr:Lrp/AsnC family transcriptional regulator [Actinocorallia populi]
MLDAVDSVLVRELQRDGRATFQALADRVGLSRTAVRARVQGLLEDGIVRVVGIVHAQVIGAGAVGHLAVVSAGPARDVALELAKQPAVCFAGLTTGPHAVVAEARARDDEALAVVVDDIRQLPGVASVEVFRSVDVVKDAHSVVRPLGEVVLDDIDWRLLQELQRDGRAPYTRLAGIIGLSQAATRARVVRLMRSGVIQVTGLAAPAALGNLELATFGVVAGSAARRVARELGGLEPVRYLSSGFGRFDLIGRIEAGSPAALVDALDSVRAVDGVQDLDSWHVLDIVKESYAADLPDR